jgi:hypothetical protein
MTVNSVVDVAIGLIFMYLVLSLVCTSINEYIATLFNLRAKTLAGGIRQLIDDPALHQLFSNHGLVDGAKAATGRGPSYLDGRAFAMALLASVDPTKPIPAFDDVQQALQHLPDSNIRDTLLAQVATAQGDIEKLRDSVANWFDHAMDRVSGLYKRWLKYISFGIGLAVALAINADSVSVAKALWHDPTVRAQIASTAEHTEIKSTASDASKTLKSSLDDLEQLRGFPLGWTLSQGETAVATMPWWEPLLTMSWWERLLVKIVGLGLTAVALSLGAPFWFDLLSKFMNIRGSGAKPDRVPPAAQGAG